MMNNIVDRAVSWSDVPYTQPMTRDDQGNPICKSCSEGKHPHGLSKYSDCKVLFDWYVGKSLDEKLRLCTENKAGGQCCCIWRVV